VAIADPKAYAVVTKDQPVDETTALRAQIALLAEQVQAMQRAQTSGQSQGGISTAQFKDMMLELVRVQADAQKEALREIAERDKRDDINYPRISVFSYPEGDKARPRPLLKCKMRWAGAELDWDVTTAFEIECLNAIEPGEYTFYRLSGAPETLMVTGERNPTGKLTSLNFMFPAKEQRDTLPPMAKMLSDALGLKTPEQREIDTLRAALEKFTVVQ
jgi:hypothetical protein